MSRGVARYTGCLVWAGLVIVAAGFVALGLVADWRLSVIGTAALALVGLLVLLELGLADVGPWARVPIAVLALLVGAGIGLLLGPRPRVVGAAVLIALALVVFVLTIRARAGLGGWALVGLFLAGLASGVWWGLLEPELLTSNEERAALDALAPRADEFADAAGTPSPRPPRLRGRIVPVDVDAGHVVESVYIRLPSELQARTPDEVSTVVLIRYGEEVVGEYGGRGEAIQLFAQITVVDLVAGRQYDGDRIEGVPPPYTSARGETQRGGAPDPQAIAAYLVDLPRRPAGDRGQGRSAA